MYLFFLTNIEPVVSWYFLLQFFEAVKEFHNLQFQPTATFKDTKLMLTQQSKHKNTDQYQGADDHVTLNLDAGVN